MLMLCDMEHTAWRLQSHNMNRNASSTTVCM